MKIKLIIELNTLTVSSYTIYYLISLYVRNDHQFDSQILLSIGHKILYKRQKNYCHSKENFTINYFNIHTFTVHVNDFVS